MVIHHFYSESGKMHMVIRFLALLLSSFERLLHPRKDRPIHFTLPKISGAEDLTKALGAVLKGLANGEIIPGEGQILAGVLEAYRKGLETADFEALITALEKRERQ